MSKFTRYAKLVEPLKVQMRKVGTVDLIAGTPIKNVKLNDGVYEFDAYLKLLDTWKRVRFFGDLPRKTDKGEDTLRRAGRPAKGSSAKVCRVVMVLSPAQLESINNRASLLRVSPGNLARETLVACGIIPE